ncbi:MAG: PadR family transcriptional regulator [Candidatus Bathyarchaeota archaeon]|nr:PadR family transcriptional regulator [Candidatus Bathyarchaeota archaeon]
MSKISGKVPRGFTRFYVLHLLTEKPMTGKEIIDEVNLRSEGDWTPSPGLIYPLLGRLVRDGLIAETDGGGFIITGKGEEDLSQYSKLQDQLDRQFQLVNKLGLSMYTAGKFIADEAIDRISVVSSSLWDRATKKSGETQRRFEEKYEEFLISEMERLKQRKTEKSLENVEAASEDTPSKEV